MEDSDYIKVYTGNFIVVQRIVSELEHHNISPIIKDESESGRLAGFGAPIQGLQELYVSKENSDVAFKVIESITSELQS